MSSQETGPEVNRREALARIALGAAMLTSAPALVSAQSRTSDEEKEGVSLEALQAKEKEAAADVKRREAELAARQKQLAASQATCDAERKQASAKKKKIPACHDHRKHQEEALKATQRLKRARRQERARKAMVKRASKRTQESALKR